MGRVDFFVDNRVMVELEAVEKIQDVHKAQAANYLEAYGIADGLLMNFGGRSLEFNGSTIRNLSGRCFRILSIRKILFIVFKTGRRPTMTDNPLPVFESYKI